MRNMSHGVVLCAVLIATVVNASEKEAPPETEGRRLFVGVVPLSLRQGLIAVDGEHVLGTNLSARIGVRFGGGHFESRGNGGDGDGQTLGMGIESGFRYYLTGTALDGLWLGPHLELSRGWFSSRNAGVLGNVAYTQQIWSAGVGALLGYSMVVSRGFTVQAGVGLGASYSSTRSNIRDTTDPDVPRDHPFHTATWGVAERATLAVGWAF